MWNKTVSRVPNMEIAVFCKLFAGILKSPVSVFEVGIL
jgi:hypothetical protein